MMSGEMSPSPLPPVPCAPVPCCCGGDRRGGTPVGTGREGSRQQPRFLAPWSCKLLHYGVAGTSPSPAAQEQRCVGLGLGENQGPPCPGYSTGHQREPYCVSGL